MVAINGQVALVTGGQRGLGKAIVDELLARGASRVYATARQPEPSHDPLVIAVPLEVTDPASVAALAAQAPDVTLVFNNAGIMAGGEIATTELDEVHELLMTNLIGPARVTRAFAGILDGNGGGALINIHSVVSWTSGFGWYGVSKAALWSATNSLRLELAVNNTLVMGVHLGFTDTDLIRDLDVPKNDPRDVARAILDGVEAGETEVLADDVSRYFKSMLSGPVEGLRIPAGAVAH